MDSTTPDAASTPAPAPAPGPAPAKPGRLRRILLVVLLAAGITAVGGAGVALVVYDRVTRPDRSAPDVVVDNYLRAMLRDRDDTRARLYSCAEQDKLDAVAAFRTDIEERERQFATQISVTWGSLTVREAGRDRAEVTVQTTRTVSGGSESDAQRWTFEVVDIDGWRVCGASLSPQ